MATTAQTFPGFYASITDKSFAPVTQSRFRGGIVGVANKGPLNTPTVVNSLTDFQTIFGNSEVYGTDDTDWKGYLAIAAASVSDFSGSNVVVRIGHEYQTLGLLVTGAPAAGTALNVVNANYLSAGDFLRIASPGVETTVDAEVESVSGVHITLVDPLDYQYPAGSVITFSSLAGAANSAEAFLDSFDFVTNEVGSSVGATVSGEKGAFTLECTDNLGKIQILAISAAAGTATVTTSGSHGYVTGDQIMISNVTSTAGTFNGTYTLLSGSGSSFTYTTSTSFSGSGTATTGIMECAALSAGDFIKIADGTNTDTGEVLVKSVVPNNTTGGCTITLYPSVVTAYGYQPLPLQDTYTIAKIYKVQRANGLANGGDFATTRLIHLTASSEGTWANSTAATNSALVVRVGPGSTAGTKKLMVYYNTQLVETLDNLTVADTAATTYIATYVNTHSSYIRIDADTGVLVASTMPANTLDGWNITTLGGQTNVANFASGADGANVTNEDWIGELDPETDLYTGFSAFRNESDYQVSILACPGATDTDVQQNLVAVARTINAEAILDIPSSLLPRQYADWRNAQGPYVDRVKIDDWHGALFGNWTTLVDPFTNDTRSIPPTISVLRCMARTFNNDKPWYVSAGDTRGFIDNATGILFRTVNSTSKTQAYNSNVNLILSQSGRIQVYGDRTLQVIDSKLTELHVAILANYIVANIGSVCRQFIFDPNDPILLNQINQAVTAFMDGVQNERGVEQYRLVVDGSNNNATTRNLREVMIDLAIIPVGAAERIFLNLSVNRSGAQLV
jgi:hypothetical protein